MLKCLLIVLIVVIIFGIVYTYIAKQTGKTRKRHGIEKLNETPKPISNGAVSATMEVKKR